MNKVELLGRFARDPEVRYGKGADASAVCVFTLAVNRPYRKEGEQGADFINCVAFGNRAEFVSKYFKKGRLVAVAGRIRTGSYTDKDGTLRYTFSVAVDEIFFTGRKEDDRADQRVSAENDFYVPADEPDPWG